MSIWDWEGMAKPALAPLLVPGTPAAVLGQQSGRQAGRLLCSHTRTGRCCRWCRLPGPAAPTQKISRCKPDR